MEYAIYGQTDTLKIIDKIISVDSFTLGLSEYGCEHHFEEKIFISRNENNKYKVVYVNSENKIMSSLLSQKEIDNFKNCFTKEIYKIQDCLCTTNTNIVLKSIYNKIEFDYSCCEANIDGVIIPMTALKKALNINL